MAELVRTTHISFPNVSGYEDITTGIASGSLSLDEILLSGNLNFGQANANKFEVQLYGISDVAGEQIEVWVVENEGTAEEVTIPLFVGRVDSCKQDNLSYYRDIVAYDDLYYKGELNVANWWTNFWLNNNSATLATIRESLCDYVGITTVSGTFLNDDLTIYKAAAIVNASFRDILAQICQLQGTFPNINRSGELEFVELSMSSSEDLRGDYKKANSSFEDFVTQKIDAVEVLDSNSEIAGTTDSSGTAKNKYTISGNIFAYGVQQGTSNALASSIYNYVKDFQYVPMQVEMTQSSLGLELGQYIQTDKGYSFIFSNSLSGSLFIEQTLQADGDEYLAGTQRSYSAEIRALQAKTESLTNDTIANALVAYQITNATTAFTLDTTWQKILDFSSFNVITSETTDLIFLGNILLEAITSEAESSDVYTIGDVEFELKYVINGGEIDYHPTHTYDDGDYVYPLNYEIVNFPAETTPWLEVWARAKKGTVTIDAGDAIGYLMGQKIEAGKLVSIAVTKNPNNTLWFVGQTLNYDGLKVTGTYNTSVTEEVTNACTYYPEAGMVFEDYDVGTIVVEVTYNELSTAFEISVNLAYLYIKYPTQVDYGSYTPVGITTYNGRLIYIYSTFVGSNTELTWYEITPHENGSLDITLLDTYDVPQYTTDPSIPIDVTYEYVHIGTKRIQTAGVGIMRNSVVRPFYYYDFADGSNGTLNVSFVLVGSSATLVRFGTYSTTDLEYAPKEVDGYILWPEITYTDSNGNSGSGYAVGNLSGTNLTIYVNRGNSFGITGWVSYTTSGTSTAVQGARSRPQLEHFTEKKYKYDISGGSTATTYYLYELTCDGTSVTRTLIWSGEGDAITGGRGGMHYEFCEYIPSARKFILATYFQSDFDAMIVDLDTLEAEHHYASSIYNDTLAQIVSNGYQPIYDPNIGKFVAVHGSTMYISDDLIYWSKVENIDSNTSGGMSVAYLPTDYGILTAAYTSGVSSYRYFSQLIYNKVE